jgi:N-acetylglucosaminyldiphosphoundecaprenol N-acetyl-beta-D-mannosaminyltransferase
LNEADLTVADGAGLMWAARYLGKPLRARVTGVELVRSLARMAEKRGFRIYLLGAREGIAQAAARVLQDEYPNLLIAGTYAGSPALEDEEGIINRIVAARPHMLFVAYGFPQQDMWIERNRNRMNVPLSMGVGGAFDYISGAIKRAPAWIRRLGLEWLYRLIRQPWRWRRMLRLPRFVWLVLRSSLWQR